jgi:hypothetical protein
VATSEQSRLGMQSLWHMPRMQAEVVMDDIMVVCGGKGRSLELVSQNHLMHNVHVELPRKLPQHNTQSASHGGERIGGKLWPQYGLCLSGLGSDVCLSVVFFRLSNCGNCPAG